MLFGDQNSQVSAKGIDQNTTMNNLLKGLKSRNQVKQINTIFQNSEKVSEILNLFANSNEEDLICQSVALILSPKLTLVQSIISDINFFNTLVNLIQTNDNQFKTMKVVDIFKRASDIAPNIFFQQLNTQAVNLLINLFYKLDVPYIYEMFAYFFNIDSNSASSQQQNNRKISDYNFIFGWLYGMINNKQKVASKLPIFENVLSLEILEKYADQINFQKCVSNLNLFTCFLNIILLFTKKASSLEGFHGYDLIFSWSSYDLLTCYKSYFDSETIQRGTRKDHSFATLLNIYSNLPIDNHMKAKSMTILKDCFFGSELSVAAVNYLIKHFDINDIKTGHDKEFFLIKLPFSLFYSLDNMKDAMLWKKYDLHKATLISQISPGTFTYSIGLEYVRTVLELTREDENLHKKVKEHIIDILLYIWSSDLDYNPFSDLKSFLLQLACTIGDYEEIEHYHYIYEHLACPFSDLNYLSDDEIMKFKSESNYHFDYESFLGIDYSKYVQSITSFIHKQPFDLSDLCPNEGEEEEEFVF